MSLSDVVDAVSLAEKGLLSPQSFQKVVSRIVRGTDAKEPCKSGAKVVCPVVRRALTFSPQACAPATSSCGSSKAASKVSAKRSGSDALSVHRVR